MAIATTVYKFLLKDEDGVALRKFASKLEATPYLTSGMTLVPLPKQASVYEQCMLTVGEAPF
jgi:hypothetical protein